MQKTAPLILLTVLIAAMVLPNIVLANFEPADPDLPANPNKDPPQVILNSPQNLQNYTADTPIPYSLTIKIPLSWFNLQTGKTYCFIRGIGYYIAPNLTASIIAGQPLEPNSPGILNPIAVPEFSVFNTTINLNGTIAALPVGNHTIVVGVSWSSQYRSSIWISYPLGEAEYDSIAYSNTTHFTITNQTKQSENSSTNREPTANLFLVLVVSSNNNYSRGVTAHFKETKNKLILRRNHKSPQLFDTADKGAESAARGVYALQGIKVSAAILQPRPSIVFYQGRMD